MANDEVTANDLLSLWGGGGQGAKPSSPAAPASQTQPNPPVSVNPPVAKTEPATLAVLPASAPTESAKLFDEPKDVSAPKPVFTSVPPPAPKPVPQPSFSPKPAAPAPISPPISSLAHQPAVSKPAPTAPVVRPEPLSPPVPKPRPASTTILPWEMSVPPATPKPAPTPTPQLVSRPVPPAPPPPVSRPIPTPEPRFTPPARPVAQRLEPKPEPKAALKPEPKPEPKKEVPKFEPVRPAPVPTHTPEKTPVLEGELVGEPIEIAMEEEHHGFAEQLNEFLAELNLSRRHIFYGIGCIVLLGGFVWGGIWGFRYYKEKNSQPIAQAPEASKEDEQKPPEPEKVPDEATGISATGEVGKLAILPPEAVGETGLAVVTALGKIPIRITPIATYILTFRQIQNAYSTDLKSLLDQSTDRRSRLRAHVALLKKLLEDGDKNLAQIQEEMEMLKSQNDAELEAQRGADENFFAELNSLNPQTSQDILDEFIRSSREVSRLRAQFKAFKKIASFYEQGLPRLAQRIRDMELNEEALVSGIKIYDVRGSDLELIVPANGGGVLSPDIPNEPTGDADGLGRAQESSIPFLPIQPIQVNTGKDFITQPGGGF